MYEKLTVKAFKDALSSNKYDTATAARRAVGKASTLSDAEKDQCRKAIDAHFGDAAPKPTKKPAKGAKEEKVSRPRAKAERRSDTRQLSIFGAQSSSLGSLDDFTNLTTQMKIAEKTIQNAGSALGTLIEAKKICPDADLSSNIEAASAVLSSAVEIFRGVTHKVTSYLADSARKDIINVQAASASPGKNGKSVVEETSP